MVESIKHAFFDAQSGTVISPESPFVQCGIETKKN